MSPPRSRSTTINISSSSWKANHKLTRNGCSRNLRISNSRSTFLTASFFMQAFLFMYFIAYIALVSFFWTMQTWKGKTRKSIKMFSFKTGRTRKIPPCQKLLYRWLAEFGSGRSRLQKRGKSSRPCPSISIKNKSRLHETKHRLPSPFAS